MLKFLIGFIMGFTVCFIFLGISLMIKDEKRIEKQKEINNHSEEIKMKGCKLFSTSFTNPFS